MALQLMSEQQILGSMLQTVLANSGLNDVTPGSVLLTLLQAAASEDFAQYYQMLQIVRNYNLDTTTNTDLDNRALEYGLSRYASLAATGRVSILRPSSFVKIATTFYTGYRARISGDTVLYLNNAAAFPTTGGQQTLIIGRGTTDEENVTYTPSPTNPQNFVNYYTITLDVPLLHDHSLGDTVILSQGVSIVIPVGTVLQVPANGPSGQVVFTTTVTASILAGEAEVDDVDVQCTVAGSIGNISVGAITGIAAFIAPPFSGAQAYNYTAFSSGQDRETDTALRNRIKAYIQSISQSTPAGISYAVNGLVDPTTAKRVVSSNIIIPDNVGLPVKVYIDDGMGFEPSFGQQGEETIIAEAIGSETRLPLQLFPLVKAQLVSIASAPYDMSVILSMAVNIGDQTQLLNFRPTMFAIPSAATAYELVQAINGQATLLEARTAAVGTQIVINAIADTSEDISVVPDSSPSWANQILKFPMNKVKTFYLYKNDKLLSKDGETAFVISATPGPYDVSTAYSLTLTVDGKTANPQIITFSGPGIDFPSPTVTTDQMIALFNTQIAGATAINSNNYIKIVSNTNLSALSKIHVTGGSANALFNFPLTQSLGADQDYLLNPELGIISLNTPLAANDLLTAGTRNTRGFLTAVNADTGNYVFTATLNLVVTIDGGAPQTIVIPGSSPIPTNYNATSLAALINTQLIGGTAVIRTVGGKNYLELRTNNFSPLSYTNAYNSAIMPAGSIKINSITDSPPSTANIVLGFTADVTVPSIAPHTAYQIALNPGPYSFVDTDTLVAVVDNNFSSNTFIITMSYGGTVAAGTTHSSFTTTSALYNAFVNNTDLPGFWVVMKSGLNTLYSVLQSVVSISGHTWQYNFKNPLPSNYGTFAAGDEVTFTGLTNAGNNGTFLIDSVTTIGVNQGSVITAANANPAVLTPAFGDRFLVAPAANTTQLTSVISKTRASPPATPGNGDQYIIAAGAGTVLQASARSATILDSSLASLTNGYRYIIAGTGLNLWAGHNQQIAQYSVLGTPGWLFFTPSDGGVVPLAADGVTVTAYYQFSSGTGTWSLNNWGGKAGQVAVYNTGLTKWQFPTVSIDKDVRLVTGDHLYQYTASTNTWSRNDWGGSANKIATWTAGSPDHWAFTTASANDTLTVTDQGKAYQYSGSAWAILTLWLRVTNLTGVAEASAPGTSHGLIGQRRQVATWNATNGTVTTLTPFTNTPAVNNTFVILPSTATNIVTFLRNLNVTSLAALAYIELTNNGLYPEISSMSDGSDGYMQITGGIANQQLKFPVNLVQGLQAYSYYTGLIKLVHSTIYGDDTNLTTYPGVGAAGVKFQILPPTVEEIAFVVGVSLGSGVSLSAVESSIETAIINYTNKLGLFAPVILSNVVEAILGVAGVTDAQITEPMANVVVNANAIARTKASLITVSVLE